ncbi:MAG: DUF4917 family protein [Phycisphaerales bacterium]|nr:DUF4917 family protein [Phycisphaerales bacterium]
MGRLGGLLEWEMVKETLFQDDGVGRGKPSILIGNGASVAVSDTFRYEALKDRADFSAVAQKLFDEIGTSDFELVLNRLGTAIQVNELHGLDGTAITGTYEEIRESLVDAVREVHIRNDSYCPETALGDELPSYSTIYSTNYDLLLYWAIMKLDCIRDQKIIDMFQGMQFDRAREFSDESTRLMYLHGALHLFLNSQGICCKRRTHDLSLLEQLDVNGVARVHFVSEGTSARKMAKIRSSDYLSYCYEHLQNDKNDIVIYGHSLSVDSDKHILDALLRHPERMFAVAIHTGGKEEADVLTEKRGFLAKLGGVDEERVVFFDSSTHPLGFPGQDTPFDAHIEGDDQ